jgi:hypothetical protein
MDRWNKRMLTETWIQNKNYYSSTDNSRNEDHRALIPMELVGTRDFHRMLDRVSDDSSSSSSGSSKSATATGLRNEELLDSKEKKMK